MTQDTDPLTILLDIGESHARGRLLVDKYDQLVSFYHLVAPAGGKDIIIPALWSNDIEKRLVVNMTKRKSREMHAIAAMFVGEAWSTAHPPDADESKIEPPSQSPDRIEIVMIIASDGARVLGRSLEMKRSHPGGRIVDLVLHDPLKVGPSAEATFSGALIDGIIRPPVRH